MQQMHLFLAVSDDVYCRLPDYCLQHLIVTVREGVAYYSSNNCSKG